MGLIDNPGTLAARYRDAILTKRLASGASIDLVQEAHELGIKLAPLKQAMQILTTMGLVESEGPGRVRVKNLSTQSIQDLDFTLTRRRL